MINFVYNLCIHFEGWIEIPQNMIMQEPQVPAPEPLQQMFWWSQQILIGVVESFGGMSSQKRFDFATS